jgi:AAA+ superfamily predicted ATPase
MKNSKEKFVILSPDGFPIEREKAYYRSIDELHTAFVIWKQRFEVQGYYSSNRGRIPLENLLEECIVKKI